MRRISGGLVVIGLALAAFSGWILQSVAQPMVLPKYIAGEHYEVLKNPVKLAANDKIEVMEVFWYGCGHCMSFEPAVSHWKKTMADDVEFMRTPAVWQKKMQAHSTLYYVAETLDLPTEIHMDIFKLLTQQQGLQDKNKFAAIFAKYGVDEAAFKDAFNSFGIKGKVKKAATRVGKNYRTQGTPELIVNGKYRVSARMAGSQARMLEVVDYLIEIERKTLPKPAVTDKASVKPSPASSPAIEAPAA
jgi:thiol:disulfide interchange protein DsbA